MTEESNIHEGAVEDVLRGAIDDADAELYLVNPSGSTIEELIDALDERSEGPTVRLLAPRRDLKDVMGDFKVASTAADLRASDRLDFRTYEEGGNTLLVTTDTVVALVTVDDRVAGLTADDDEFVSVAYEKYERAWSDAEEYTLRTPAITDVRTTLSDRMGGETADDFDSVLASLETARGDGDGLDEVTISLLVAAKNRELLYDISKWGEDVGIASKATFSRTKSRLEELGLIETEKVPIDVGRPRLRLMLGDDRLQDADSDQLASVAQSILAS